MALRGTAALAMWWDMTSHMKDQFENWHTHEHFPERLGIPGFLRSSRWTDADGGEGVFVLYELDSHTVLSSAPYLARLNAPTPWSAVLMPYHRNMVRTQSHVEATFGGVAARYALTLGFSMGQANAAAAVAALSTRLRGLVQTGGVVGGHLLHHEAPAIALTTEQKIRGTPDRAVDWVLIVCGYAREALQDVGKGVTAHAESLGFRITLDDRSNTFVLSYSAIPSDFH